MKKVVFIVLGLSLIANILLFVFIASQAKPPKEEVSSSTNDYPLLSKRIFIESQNDIIVNFVELRKSLNEYAIKHHLDGNADTQFSMYFEYLPSGNSIGINEKSSFIAASLLKVPIIMGVYKYIETGKMKEDTMLTLKEADLDPNFGNLWKKGIGATISVADAVKLTLSDSDNTAKAVLFNNVPIQTLTDVYNYLDIPSDTDSNAPVVSSKNYSSILRSLYLSTYLSLDNSQKILSLLTTTPFNDKIAAGVPNDVKVAHKIGVHDTSNPKGSIYTDCGIVYATKRPYILCMMMRDSEDNVRTHMKAISRIIYDYIKKANTTSN